MSTLDPSSPRAIKATVWRVRDLFTAPKLTPASVQRGFEWGADEARTLLHQLDLAFTETTSSENVVSAADRDDGDGAAHAERPSGVFHAAEPVGPVLPPITYALGTMVLLARDDNEIEIYDGQQRTTTLTILLSVLRDLEENVAFKAELNGLIWRDANAPRLQLSSRDPTLLRDAQSPGGTQRHRRINAELDVGKQIQRVKNTFWTLVERWEPSRRALFARFLMDHVLIAVQFPADARLARQMFVSTNLYGKRLDQMSLLKGMIGDLATNQDEAETVAALWTSTKERLGGDFDGFMRAIDVIERVSLDARGRAELQHDNWCVELGSHLERNYRQGKIVGWVEWLRDYSYAWDELQKVVREAGPGELEQNTFRLSAFPAADWQPLALFYWQDIRRETAAGQFTAEMRGTYANIFARMHRSCMALTLGGSAAARQQAFAKAVWQAKCGVDPTLTVNGKAGDLVIFAKTKLKIDRELRAQIKTEEIWIPLVRWLEMQRWRPGLPQLMREGSVEHVKSRNPAPEQLASQPTYDQDCYSLGNLALINKIANGKLENKRYADKRETLKLEAAKYDLVGSVVVHARFDAQEIATRAALLQDSVWAYLNMPPRPGPKTQRNKV
jgi:hypothetical protein